MQDAILLVADKVSLISYYESLLKPVYQVEKLCHINKIAGLLAKSTHIKCILFSYDEFRNIMESDTFLLSNINIPIFPIVTEENLEKEEDPIGRLIFHGMTDIIVEPVKQSVLLKRLEHSIKRYVNIYQTQMNYTYIVSRWNAFINAVKNRMMKRPDVHYQMVYIDFDKVKLLNELYGIQKVDRILSYLEENIMHYTHDVNGIVGRKEADILVFSMMREESLMPLADYIEENLEEFPDFPLNIKMRFSIGGYMLDDKTLSVEGIIDRARVAAKSIKGSYLSRTISYTDAMREVLIDEQAIINEMERALKEHEIKLYIQMQNDMKDGAVIGGEILARWQHPKKGLIFPDGFVPIFEKSGFIRNFDLYICKETCKLIKEWSQNGYKNLPLSINLSGISFYYTDLYKSIIETVEYYGIAPSSLELEITESVYTDNIENFEENFNKLQEYGFSIIMDDFGSGYSSLNMLKNIPVNILKLDMEFLKGWNTRNEREINIVKSIVNMSRNLNMHIIIEGVETKEQVDFLLSLDCRYAQGYYYAKPMPVDDFEKLLYAGDMHIRYGGILA